MQLFFAAGARAYLYLLLLMNVEKILVSYAYPEIWKSKKILEHHKLKLMADSGAFTAWTKGKKIDIDEYIKFLRDHIDIIDRYVNLDVIPGIQGTPPTPDEVESSAEQGWKNYEYFKKEGLDPIHVFHQGESWEWLRKMLKECHYIGVSHNKDKSTSEVDKWLYQCFYIIKNSNNPDIKTHAFGLTSPSLLNKYPYYSVDSATWALTSAMGSIYTPFGRYRISDEERDKPDPSHIKKQNEIIQNKVKEYIEEFGFSLEAAADVNKGYKFRNLLNIKHFLDFEEKTQNVIYNDNQSFLPGMEP